MARAKLAEVVDQEVVADALAKAVADGDLVNFRLLFQPFSPARAYSSEAFGDDKYAYLLPDAEQAESAPFKAARHAVRDVITWSHIQKELEAERPAQLPSNLVLHLADRALTLGKHNMAAQAYEMLRIRTQMQDEILRQADEAFDGGDLDRAVDGYLMAVGLDYDYAAFPEPLPKVLNFQQSALILHAQYPRDVRESVSLQDPPVFLRTALTYLLASPETAQRLESRSLDQQVAFLEKLVHRRDPDWADFVAQYKEAATVIRRFNQDRFDRENETGSIETKIAEEMGDDPEAIPAALLGRSLNGGEWWQYMKELAYEHPPAPLFIARQIAGQSEILVPRLRADSPIPAALGIDVEEN